MATPEEKFEKILKDIKLTPINATVRPQLPPQYDAMIDQYMKQLQYNSPDKPHLEAFVKDLLQKQDQLLTDLSGLKRDQGIEIQIMSGQEWLVSIFKDIGSKIDTAFIAKTSYYLSKKQQQEWQNASLLGKIGMAKDQVGKAVKRVGSAIEGIKMISESMKYVLGQYDNIGKQQIDHKVLRILVPNVFRIANEAGINPEDLLTSVALHEDTHNRQFTNYPILETTLHKTVEELIAAQMISEYNGAGDLTGAEAKGIAKKKEDSLQTMMSVVEGHAVLFEEELSKRVIVNYDQMQAKMDEWRKKRREEIAKRKNYPEQMKKKREQYIKGLKFMEEVYSVHGNKSSKLVFENLPTIEELENPKKYLSKF